MGAYCNSINTTALPEKILRLFSKCQEKHSIAKNLNALSKKLKHQICLKLKEPLDIIALGDILKRDILLTGLVGILKEPQEELTGILKEQRLYPFQLQETCRK